METDIVKIKLGIQETVADLFSEHLIPFKLTAYKVTVNGLGECDVLFYDSRLPSVKLSCKDGESLQEVVRAAVLYRLENERTLVFPDRRVTTRRRQDLQVANILG